MSLAAALAEGPVVLDGGLATQLEAAGHDLSDNLWSARLLADSPQAILGAHMSFLRAGASVVTTSSYQASVEGFVKRGYRNAEGLLRRSVGLAGQAVANAHEEGVERPLWIAASVGPYGAVLADGSEYRGDYGLTEDELVAFHRPRLLTLAAAGPDVLALETVPDVREAAALLRALDGVGVPAWLSYAIRGDKTRAGQPLEEAFALVAGRDDIIAVGVNCSTPSDVSAAVALAASVSGKPVVVYPNSGEEWDAQTRSWTGTPSVDGWPVASWVADGARLVGGCCRVMPTHIAGIAAQL